MKAWIARAIYYPTLGYNLFMGRVLKVRRWWDAVGEQLYLGARPMPGDPKRFKDLGITGVVNTCEEMPGPTEEYQRLGIEQLWIPTTDFHHPSEAHVEAGAEFIQRHIDNGGKVYVHCKAGRARSATIVVWWLIRFAGQTPEQAQRTVLSARPHANPRIFLRPVIQSLAERYSSSSSDFKSELPE